MTKKVPFLMRQMTNLAKKWLVLKVCGCCCSDFSFSWFILNFNGIRWRKRDIFIFFTFWHFFSSAKFGLFTKVSRIGSYFIQILTNFPNFCKKPNQKISKTLALPHIFLIGLHIILPYLRVVRPCSLVIRGWTKNIYTHKL